MPHLGATKLIFGQKFELDSPPESSSFVSLTLTVGMQFARDAAVPLVIVDPEGLWNDCWGILSDRNVIAPSPAIAMSECSSPPMAAAFQAATQ